MEKSSLHLYTWLIKLHVSLANLSLPSSNASSTCTCHRLFWSSTSMECSLLEPSTIYHLWNNVYLLEWMILAFVIHWNAETANGREWLSVFCCFAFNARCVGVNVVVVGYSVSVSYSVFTVWFMKCAQYSMSHYVRRTICYPVLPPQNAAVARMQAAISQIKLRHYVLVHINSTF